MAYDADYTDVVLLLHLNGSNGAATFTDRTGRHTFSAVSSAALSTAQQRFGTASLSLDGASKSITAPDSADWDFGTADFTLEFSVYVTSYPGAADRSLFYFASVLGATGPLSVGLHNGYLYAGPSNISYGATSATLIPTGSWVDVEVSRASGTTKIFMDGVQVASAADTYNYSANDFLWIGGVTGSTSLDGYIDEVRITKGLARHTSGFTVAGAEFGWAPTITGVVKDTSLAFAARVCRSYSRSTGEMLDETTSDAGDGTFTLDAPGSSGDVYLVVLDEDIGSENALIFDRLTGT